MGCNVAAENEQLVKLHQTKRRVISEMIDRTRHLWSRKSKWQNTFTWK